MRRRQDVVWRTVPGFLAVSREGRDVTAVFGAAADVWDLLAEPTSSTEIAATLAARYSAPVEEVARDVDSLLDLLTEQGYVEADTCDEPADAVL